LLICKRNMMFHRDVRLSTSRPALFGAILTTILATTAATAAEPPPPPPTAVPDPAAATPAKQWVWLTSQGVWGYGYQRTDGLWVIDPGSKRAPAAQPAAEQQQAAADPYGFVGWLNSTRASAGLGPVGVDGNLTALAQANNAQQAARGMGHHLMGARRQNVAMGSSASIGAMWMASPAHRAALLDPSIRWIGIAGLGAYWTFNAN
jgi:uncharacterized protein YkwD